MGNVIVYLAGVSWDDVRGTDRQLVEQLARTEDVVWVDPPLSAARVGRVRGLSRALAGGCVSSPMEGVTRLSVVGPPFPLRPGVARLTHHLLRRAVRSVLESRDVEVAAVVNASPYLSFDVVRDVRASTRLYFATDDFAAAAAIWGRRRSGMVAAEQRRLRESDVVAAVSPLILRRWEPLGRPAYVLPNGCDSEAYRRVPGSVPSVLAERTRPVAGLVGQISARIDLSLLEAVADRQVTLLLVGPVLDDVDQARMHALLARANVVAVGRQPFSALPGFLAAMDVGLTPYQDSEFNRASFPLKSLEYLAAGLPVVSTPLPSVAALGTPLIATGSTPQAFADAVEQLATDAHDPALVAARQEFAAEHDWSVRATSMRSMLGRGA